jgi:hypothetical protein
LNAVVSALLGQDSADARTDQHSGKRIANRKEQIAGSLPSPVALIHARSLFARMRTVVDLDGYMRQPDEIGKSLLIRGRLLRRI